MQEIKQYKIVLLKNGKKEIENSIEMRIVDNTDTHIHQYENEQASIEYNLSEDEISLEMTFEGIENVFEGDILDKVYGWHKFIDSNENPLVLLDTSVGLTFSQYINKQTYESNKIKTYTKFLNNILYLIEQNTEYYGFWIFKKPYDHHFGMIIQEAKEKTVEWLAIKTRLINKGYDKNDLKIKIGYWYCYDARPCDPKRRNPYERYPIYLNICEDYYHSFRFDTDKTYNAARSIFDLIIYKEEWYDTMFFEWDLEALETYKYLFFKDKNEFKKTDGYAASYYDSEFDMKCWEEEQGFRG